MNRVLFYDSEPEDEADWALTDEEEEEQEYDEEEEEDDEEEEERAPEPVARPRGRPPGSVNRVAPPAPSLPISQYCPTLDTRICILGPTQSGKTTIIRHLIRNFVKTKTVAAVYWFGDSYHEEKWLPPGRGEALINTAKLEALRTAMKSPNMAGKHAIVVLDDVLGEEFLRGKQGKWWSRFISTSRHYNITLLIGMQYLKGISPVMRDNVKQWIVTWINHNGIEALHKQSRSSKPFFRQELTDAKRGAPKLIDFDPDAPREITTLSVPKLDTI